MFKKIQALYEMGMSRYAVMLMLDEIKREAQKPCFKDILKKARKIKKVR